MGQQPDGVAVALAETVRSARHHMVLHCAHDGETVTANECLTALVGMRPILGLQHRDLVDALPSK